MPRTLPNILFAKETDKSAQCQLFHLVVVEDPKSIVPTMHYVDSNYDVTYGGQLYQRFPLKFSGISVSSDGSIDKASITVANAARLIMPLVEEYDGLAGFNVSVITVYEKFLDFTYSMSLNGTLTSVANAGADSTAHIRDEFVIDSYTATEQTIVFQLNAVVDFDIRVPRRRFTPFSCYWRFRESTTCGYGQHVSETLPECKKSLEDCLLHVRFGLDPAKGNSARFGGFPGVPSDVRRLYL